MILYGNTYVINLWNQFWESNYTTRTELILLNLINNPKTVTDIHLLFNTPFELIIIYFAQPYI